MTHIQDQFSAVRKAQFDAQFDFFNSMTTQAIESASRVAALNLALSRDAVQRSLGAGFALMSSRDPRDVLGVGGQAEEQMRSLFAYGRELLGIASGVRPYPVRPQALAAQPEAEAVEVVEQVAERVLVDAVPAPAPAVDAAPAAASTEPVGLVEPQAAAEPLAVAAEPEPVPVPVGEPKAIAKAAGKGNARAAAVPHPAAAPVEPAGIGEAKIALAPVSAKRKK